MWSANPWEYTCELLGVLKAKTICMVMLRGNLPFYCSDIFMDGAKAMMAKTAGVLARIKVGTPNYTSLCYSLHYHTITVKENVSLLRTTIDEVVKIISSIKMSTVSVYAFLIFCVMREVCIKIFCYIKYDGMMVVSRKSTRAINSLSCQLNQQLFSWDITYS